MTDLHIKQAPLLVLASVAPDLQIKQAPVLVLASVGVPLRITGAAALVLASVVAPLQIKQAPVLVLASSVPCLTRWAQIWTIARTDGQTLRFTSLDRDLVWGGATYKSCDSLVPSAAESSDEVAGVGNMELAGILSDASVSAADLAAGRYDGAYAEAWLVPWEADGATPRRLLAGTFGKLEYGEAGWSVELVGDGARLQQTPLHSTFGPGCRFQFGDSRCGVDLGPLTVTGTVDAGGAHGFTDTARAEPAGYFRRGQVTFTGGANAGIAAEIRDHAAGGVFTLWPRLSAAIAAGDTYSMTPGCMNAKASDAGTNGCDGWANYERYGGQPDVPGQDALNETPDAR